MEGCKGCYAGNFTCCVILVPIKWEASFVILWRLGVLSEAPSIRSRHSRTFVSQKVDRSIALRWPRPMDDGCHSTWHPTEGFVSAWRVNRWKRATNTESAKPAYIIFGQKSRDPGFTQEENLNSHGCCREIQFLWTDAFEYCLYTAWLWANSHCLSSKITNNNNVCGNLQVTWRERDRSRSRRQLYDKVDDADDRSSEVANHRQEVGSESQRLSLGVTSAAICVGISLGSSIWNKVWNHWNAFWWNLQANGFTKWNICCCKRRET